MSNLNKQIQLVKEVYRSEFLNELYEKELRNICSKEFIYDESLNICTNYVCENEVEIECGIFIINNSKKDIYVKELPVKIKNDEKVIVEKWININKNIEAEKAIFTEIITLKECVYGEYNLNKMEVVIGRCNELRVYDDVHIYEFPKMDKYGAYRAVKKFLKEIPLIEENEIRIDIFKVGSLNEGLCVIGLFRNSLERVIKIKSIPMEVYTENGTLIYKGVYKLKEGLEIQGEQGIFYSMILPWNKFYSLQASTLHNFFVKIVE